MTNPVFDGLAEGLQPIDTIPSRDLALIGIDAKLGRLETLQERATVAAEAQAAAFQTLVALIASCVGVSHAWCPDSPPGEAPLVNYFRSSSDGKPYRCDQTGDDDEGEDDAD